MKGKIKNEYEKEDLPQMITTKKEGLVVI